MLPAHWWSCQPRRWRSSMNCCWPRRQRWLKHWNRVDQFRQRMRLAQSTSVSENRNLRNILSRTLGIYFINLILILIFVNILVLLPESNSAKALSSSTTDANIWWKRIWHSLWQSAFRIFRINRQRTRTKRWHQFWSVTPFSFVKLVFFFALFELKINLN